MLLLTNVMEHSLDDGYAEAAARREADGRAGMPRTLKAKLGFAACLVWPPWSSRSGRPRRG